MDEQPIMNDEQPTMDEQPDLTEEQLSNILDEGIQICADLIDINQIPQRLSDITAIVSSINNIGIYSPDVQHKYFMLCIMEQGLLFPEMTVELFFVADVNDDWIYDLEDVRNFRFSVAFGVAYPYKGQKCLHFYRYRNKVFLKTRFDMLANVCGSNKVAMN